jgi:hypothetical protein
VRPAGRNRVGGELALSVLPHHRTCGSAYGDSHHGPRLTLMPAVLSRLFLLSRFRRYPQNSASFELPTRPAEIRSASHDKFSPSSITRLLWPLLTSVNPSSRLTARIAFRQIDRPPRVLRTRLHAYARRIYFHTFRTGIGL